MESNFIKERIVVREKIIKDNIESSRNRKQKPIPHSSSNVKIDKPSKELIVLEELVNEKFKSDLVDLSIQVDKICETIADYLKIKSALNLIRLNPRDIRLQTNIGCNFYAQCHVDDASKVYVCIGLDLYFLMEIDEAIKMVEFKEKQWTKQLDVLQVKASKIKAYIKVALETMGQLYEQ